MEGKDIQRFLEQMKKIQQNLLVFIQEESNENENFEILNKIFEDSKICDNKHEINSVLHMIANIANNHHHVPNFFNKIDKVLNYFKDSIKKYYSNIEIFNIFRDCKRTLLFLVEEQIINIDKSIITTIGTLDDFFYSFSDYAKYFKPEIEKFKNEKWFPEKFKYPLEGKIQDDFYEKRKIGENDSLIYKLIQKDSIIEFIKCIEKENIQIDEKITHSFYDSNIFLYKNRAKNMLYYAAFYGSIQIFNYLRLKNIKLEPELWEFAIHGQNAEIIHILEENNVVMLNEKCIQESIKCHHNDIANYFLNNSTENEKFVCEQAIMYYNYEFVKSELIDQSLFVKLCQYDHYQLVDFLLKNNDIDVNQKDSDKKTALYNSVDAGNIDIVKLLLTKENIDVNIPLIIFWKFFFIVFENEIYFYYIQCSIFQ